MPTIDHSRRHSVDLLAITVAIWLVCDFLIVPIWAMWSAWPIPGILVLLSLVGCVLAQGCLLAAWMAWSDQRFWLRFTGHWTAAAILYVAWAAGLFISHPDEFAQVSSFVGLSGPLVSIAAQTPPWLARQVLGWRLIRGDLSKDDGPAPLSIRGLMVATLMTALALSLARLACNPNGAAISGWIWIAELGTASALSAIALMPPAAILMRARQLKSGMKFAGLYALSWLGILWAVIFVGLRTGLFRVPPLVLILAASWIFITFAATVVLAAATARSCGYRLVWGVSRRVAPQTAKTRHADRPDLAVAPSD